MCVIFYLAEIFRIAMPNLECLDRLGLDLNHPLERCATMEDVQS